jgi:hypothetical protein
VMFQQFLDHFHPTGKFRRGRVGDLQVWVRMPFTRSWSAFNKSMAFMVESLQQVMG